MYDFLRTLAITVDSPVDTNAAALAEKAAQERTVWIILLVIMLALEIAFAVVFPKILKKVKAEKAEKSQKNAERKRIQSKRK